MKVYAVAAKRTAVGSFLGSLKDVSPADMGAVVVNALLKESHVAPEQVDELICGNILCAGQAQGVARQVAIKSGIPVTTCAYGINMICGSGMKAVLNGVTSIQAGYADIIVAGGSESMSGAPMLLPSSARSGMKMGHLTLVDHMICDALTDAFENVHMGITAENIAELYSISREDQDAFAYASQQKAIAAVDSGRFDEEIVPVSVKIKKETIEFKRDEYPNRTTDPQKLAKLRPAFKKDGSVTAGNSSGLNDGASFVLLASEQAVKKYELEPLCEIVGIGQGGVEPRVMGLGPVPAVRQALERAGLKLADMDLIELNEAFAAQSLGVIEELIANHEISREELLQRTNVNGGAIALGHPVGASGNRILVTLLHEMKKRNSQYGLASLCIGGGMGTAVVVKSIKG